MRTAFETIDDDDPVLVWSNEHQAWWGPREQGYVPAPAFAGRFSRKRARQIIRDAYIGWNPANPCPEVIVPTGPQLGPFELAHLAVEMTETATAAWEARERLAQQQIAVVYNERSHLIAYLAAIHPSVLVPAPDAPGYSLVYITLPEGAGQISYHIHPNDLYLFDRTARFEEWKWDGHTTAEKYRRLRHATETAHTWVAGPVGG